MSTITYLESWFFPSSYSGEAGWERTLRYYLHLWASVRPKPALIRRPGDAHTPEVLALVNRLQPHAYLVVPLKEVLTMRALD